jgi:hypothetical protein
LVTNFTCSSVGVKTGFKGDGLCYSSANTSDLSQGKGDLLSSVDVRVEDTKDKSEVFFVFELNAAALRK